MVQVSRDAGDSQRRPSRVPATWRVAVVEDHLLQRQRTVELIESEEQFTVVHSCESLPDLMRWTARADPRLRAHLIVLDLMVDRSDDADMALVAKLVDAGVRVLVLSALASPPLVASAIRAGVAGVLGKQDPEDDIVAALHEVARGGSWVTASLAVVMAGDSRRPPLSDQEERALVLYASGLTLDSVALSLGVKSGTAKKYLVRAKEKYAAAGRPIRTKIEMSREVERDGLMFPELRPPDLPPRR